MFLKGSVKRDEGPLPEVHHYVTNEEICLLVVWFPGSAAKNSLVARRSLQYFYYILIPSKFSIFPNYYLPPLVHITKCCLHRSDDHGDSDID